jgi:uncharacterized protein (TIGR00369 family)
MHDVCERFNTAAYYKMLGMVASSDAPGRARIVLPFKPELTQVYGNIHGGALLSIADSAINLAIATTFTEGETIATVDLSMSFLARAGRRDLVADATIVRRGNRVAFAECVIRAGDEDVARAHGTCYVSSRKP